MHKILINSIKLTYNCFNALIKIHRNIKHVLFMYNIFVYSNDSYTQPRDVRITQIYIQDIYNNDI